MATQLRHLSHSYLILGTHITSHSLAALYLSRTVCKRHLNQQNHTCHTSAKVRSNIVQSLLRKINFSRYVFVSGLRELFKTNPITEDLEVTLCLSVVLERTPEARYNCKKLSSLTEGCLTLRVSRASGRIQPSTGPRFPYGTTVTCAYSRPGWPHWTS